MKQTVINPGPFYAVFSANLILACACLRLAIVRMALGVKLLAIGTGQNYCLQRTARSAKADLAFQTGRRLLCRETFALPSVIGAKRPNSHFRTFLKDLSGPEYWILEFDWLIPGYAGYIVSGVTEVLTYP